MLRPRTGRPATGLDQVTGPRYVTGPSRVTGPRRYLAALLVVTSLVLLTLVSPALAVDYGSDEVEFVQLLNDYRVANGLEPLLVSDMLSEASERHSSDMAKYGFVSHYTRSGSDWFPLGSSPWDRMAASGYTFNTAKGENIAAGQTTATEVFQAWKESPDHNANMLCADFTVVGVALISMHGSDYGTYWTTDFGRYADESAHALTSPAGEPKPVVPAPPATPTGVSSPFSDVGPGTLYGDQIALLAEKGIVSGYKDGTFGPDDPITRQQFAKMLALTVGYDVYPVTTSGFVDVEIRLDPQDALYPAGYIAACLAAGVIQGKSAGTFAPLENITQAQLITMVARAARPAELATQPGVPFGDFCPDHYPWAAKAWAAGLLNGLTDMGADFDFWAEATRAEACLILCNLLAQG